MYDKTKYIYVGLDLHKEQHTADNTEAVESRDPIFTDRV